MLRHKPIIQSLGPDFYDPVVAAQFPRAQTRYLNHQAAQFLGLEAAADTTANSTLTSPTGISTAPQSPVQTTAELQTEADWIRRFHRFESWPENIPQPLALRYHGHQFRHYNPDLGDGRGFLFAQFCGADGQIYDLGTKGSGQTPYSRAGDGRLTLKGAYREALATELLETLGVKTSRTFCFFETGEHLERNDEPSPTRAGVLTRMSLSHLRIGSFQRQAFLKQPENVLKLMKYSVENYFPEISQGLTDLQMASAFLKAVSRNLARLAAQYMISGFVHGVLNSDNINITGESFDYGPYRFLPAYDPNFTAAYFDSTGLYSFGRQPTAINWDLAQLAGCLQLALPDLPAKELIQDFGEHFAMDVLEYFFRRLNLKMKPDRLANDELISRFFVFLAQTRIGYEQLYFDLFGGVNSERLRQSPAAEFYQNSEFKGFEKLLLRFEVADPALSEHPYFQRHTPCTLLIDEIEAMWKPIAEHDDWTAFNTKLADIRSFRGIYSRP